MKQLDGNRSKFFKASKSLLLSFILLASLMTGLGNAFLATNGSPAYARIPTPGNTGDGSTSAIPSDTTLYNQGKASRECISAADNDTTYSDDARSGLLDICAKGYVSGYKNPTYKASEGSNGYNWCRDNVDGIAIAQYGFCGTGFDKGQKVRLAANAAAANPTTGELTDAQIQALGESSNACGEASDDPTFNANHRECVKGYVGGYKGESKSATCSSSVLENNCNTGWEAGKADKAANVKNEADQATANGTGANSTAEEDEGELGCDASESPLTWIICPVIDLMVNLVNTIDGIITQRLSIDTNEIFCGEGTCDAYYQAWKQFRNIALGLLVLVGLIVLISQALGLEILDAYTIRKMLPRVLVAAIGITLSWPIMQFLISFSNDLGFAVRRLIYAPFADLGGEIDLSFGEESGVGNGIANVFFGTGAVAVAGAAVWFLQLGLFLSYALTAALAVFVAIIVLILREVLIIMLLFFAPIAIIAYALPNTQKIYNLWSDSFMKALMMFPLIAAFIASGRVFSAIALSGTPGLLTQMIGFAAYFAPYFLIPLTVKFAGGALRQLGGFVNDRGRGGFDRLRNRRGERLKKRGELVGHKFKTGDFHNPVPGRFKRLNSKAGTAVNALNAVGTHTSAGLIRGGLGFGARGQTAREGLLMQGAKAASEEQAMQDMADSNAGNRLMALTGKNHGNQVAAEEELRKWYATDRSEYGRLMTPDEVEGKVVEGRAKMANAGGYNPGRAVAAVMAMGRDGTAIRDVQDMGELVAGVSEGSEDMAYKLISQVASDSKRVGRTELAPSQDHKSKLATATIAAQKHGKNAVPNYDSIIQGATMSGAGGATGYEVMGNAPSRVIRGNVEHAMDVVGKYMKDPNSVEYSAAAQAAAVIQDLQNTAKMGQGKQDNKIELMNAMSEKGRAETMENFLSLVDPRATGPVTDDFGNSRQAHTVSKPSSDDQGNAIPDSRPTVRDSVRDLVGARYDGVSPEQMANMSAQERAAQQAADEAARNNQQGG